MYIVRKFLRNPCNVYFSLWSIYLLQGILYPSGAAIAKIVLFLILAISLKHAIKSYRGPKLPIFFKGLNLLTIIYVVYGALYMISEGAVMHTRYGDLTTMYYLWGYMMSLLPIYTCYHYTKKGFLNQSLFQKWLVVFFILGIMNFFLEQQRVIEEAFEKGSQYKDNTNNMGYTILALIPCMLLYKNKWLIHYSGIALCTLFLIMSMKRGAILCGGIALTFILFHEFTQYTMRQKMAFTLVVGILFFFIYDYIQSVMLQNDFFLARINATMEGETSGRDSIYLTLWNHFLFETDFIHQLVGNGAWETYRIDGHVAHNDWLETLIDQGLIGAMAFLLYWLFFFTTIRNRGLSSDSRFALKIIFIIYFLMTFFSMSIGDMPIFATSIMAFSLADGFRVTPAVSTN